MKEVPTSFTDKLAQTYGGGTKATPKQVYDQIHLGEKFDLTAVDRYLPTDADLSIKEGGQNGGKGHSGQGK